MTRPLVGVFVGGQGRRMGGLAKGLLAPPSGERSIVERLVTVARDAVGEADVVLVGDASMYGAVKLDALADAPPGIGPLGGLLALLGEAERRDAPYALALACDLPFVTPTLLSRLAGAEPAPAVVPRAGEHLQPLCARYAPNVRPVAESVLGSDKRSLHAVLDALGEGVRVVELSAAESVAVDDWDTPEDVARR